MNEGQELVEAPITEIMPFNKFEAQIVEFEKENASLTYDLTTETGIVACEDRLKKLRKVEIEIEKVRKVKGADLLKATKDLNTSAKVWHGRVHEMWEVIDKPLQVIRQIALDAEIDAHEKAQAEEKAIEDKLLADLKAREDKVAEDEAKLVAANAKIKEAADAAQSELDRIQREKDIAEAGRIAAEKAVIKEKADAHQRENDRIAKELAEKNRLAEIETKRQADVEHQRDFNQIAVDEITKITDLKSMSIDIVTAIVKGEIPNVSMKY